MAKTLILVRHAHALSRYEAVVSSDGARPLSPQGRGQAQKTAQAIAAQQLRPQKILTSPLLRAEETARILAATLRAPVEQEPVLDGAHTDLQVRDLLLAKLAACDTLLAVGHNPCITYVTALLCAQVRPFAPASFAVIRLDPLREPQLIFFGE